MHDCNKNKKWYYNLKTVLLWFSSCDDIPELQSRICIAFDLTKVFSESDMICCFSGFDL